MKVSRFVYNLFGVNTYVMWDEATRECAIVDPGMTSDAERKAMEDFIDRQHLRPVHLIDTHMHLDHIFGNQWVKTRYGLDIQASPDDYFLGRDLEAQARTFHIPTDATGHTGDVELHDGDILYVGSEPIHIMAVPGHSPGSVALYCPESAFVITGDALFCGSIGRTDLAGGDYDTLMASLRRMLLALPPDTVVLPGHGPETTVRAERRNLLPD